MHDCHCDHPYPILTQGDPQRFNFRMNECLEEYLDFCCDLGKVTRVSRTFTERWALEVCHTGGVVLRMWD
jgi:hypothetical protein